MGQTYMKKSTPTNLPCIGTMQIRQLAKSADCDESYVRKVLSGTRDNNTRVSKAILRGAKYLNARIESAHSTVNKKIQTEID